MDWTIVIFISFIVPVSIITIIGLAGSLHFKKGSLIPVTKSEYLTDLGRRQFFEGNYGEAIDTCTAAIAIDGDNADAYRYRAYAYDGLKLYGSSIEDYTKAIELNPGDIFLYNDRGKARLRLNEKDSACEDFRKACDLENKDGCGLYDSNCK
jgi:tetratricopeptide (TPR) repeat protein